MDQDLNNLNQFLEDHDSYHLLPSTQARTIRRPSVEAKHVEQLISPANITNVNRMFMLPSPSPFKHNPGYFYEEEQSDEHEIRDGFVERRGKKIQGVINFEDPLQVKKNNNLIPSTASSQRFVHKNNSTKPQALTIKDDKKNSKGLRNLSESVYRIVKELSVTTYKEVADQLVRMLNAGEFGPLEEDTTKAKDEQNIKRRVYDALNVLISADVLKKNGKHVMSQQDSMSDKNKFSTRGGKKQDQDNLWQQIMKKQMQLKQKKQKIEQLKNKKEILTAILKRNKKKKPSSSSTAPQQKITFPLIGITYKLSIPKITRNENHSRVSLPITNSIEVVGDMDLLVKAGIDVLSQNIQEIMGDCCGEDEELVGGRSRRRVSPVGQGSGRQKSRVLYSL